MSKIFLTTFLFLQNNGLKTLSENIADNSGLREAVHAYREFTRLNGEEPLLIGLEKYSHEQLLHLSFAQVCSISKTFIYYYFTILLNTNCDGA